MLVFILLVSVCVSICLSVRLSKDVNMLCLYACMWCACVCLHKFDVCNIRDDVYKHIKVFSLAHYLSKPIN